MYKYKQGAQGKDKIPNYEFWAKMPGLIKVTLHALKQERHD